MDHSPQDRPAPPFDAVFLDLDGTLVRGTRAPLEGARALIEALDERGMAVAVASLAGQGFVDAGLALLGSDLPLFGTRSLDSPGCADKRAMLEDLCLTLGTRSAVMLGDSSGDRSAALGAGLPFVHFRGSGAMALEEPGEELQVLTDLPARLERRREALLGLWEALQRPPRLALVGAGGSGVDLLGRDLARAVATETGRPTRSEACWESGPPASGAPFEGLLVAHGAAAAEDWPSDQTPVLVEVRAHPRRVAGRLQARYAPEGPQAVRAALAREAEERLRVARACAAAQPQAWLDGGDVFGLGRGAGSPT